MKILILGKGYIGRRCADTWNDAVISDKFIKSTEDVLQLLDKHSPDVVLNAAGVVGKPNVDWCETHQLETIEGNTVLPLLIAKACQARNVYLLHIGTGCIFYGEAPDGEAWTEDDYANPVAVYTRCKYAADLALATMDNVGIGRIRMPIDHIPHKANLIDKVASFKRVIDVDNSVTIIEDMMQVFHQLLEKRASGVFHVTNPGSIKHKEILSLYEKYVDSQHNNEWITEEQLVSQGLADKK